MAEEAAALVLGYKAKAIEQLWKIRSVKRLCLPQEIVARLYVHKTDAIIRSLGTAGTVRFVQ